MKLISWFLIGLLLLSSASTFAKIPDHAQSGTRSAVINSNEVIFIHGMFMTPKCWDEWTAYFADRGFQVSAPAWPLHENRLTNAKLAKLTLDQVVEKYRAILRHKKQPPILVGHSMGGLVAQILLSEGLASAAIAIDSAPPRWVITLVPSFIIGNWPTINPFKSENSVVDLTKKQFNYAFANRQTEEMKNEMYKEFYRSDSRRLGRAPLKKVASIDKKAKRGPLLLIAGEDDHVVPAQLNYNNFKFYKKSPSYTEFKMFAGRDHWIIGGPGWQEVADYTLNWIEGR